MGKTGSGKSYLARSQLATFPRFIIFDPNAEPANVKLGRPVHDFRELVDLLIKAKGGPVRITWRGMIGAANPPEEYDRANAAALAAENLAVLWDEVDQYAVEDRVLKLRPFARQVINTGRHRGLKVLACSRRPAMVPRDLTANAQRIIVFHTHEPRDLLYFRQLMGRQVSDQLKGLREAERECLEWTEAGAVLRKSPFE